MKYKKNKIIGIDARFYSPLNKGLGRYTQEIIDNIIDKIDNPRKGGYGENQYVVFLSPENFGEFKTTNPNVKKVLFKIRWYSLAEQLFMPFFIFKEKIDLMYFPHFNVPIFCPTKFIVTIHDLILTKFPTPRATTLSPLLYKVKNLGYKIVIWFAVVRAKKIITVSRFTKNDIIKQFKVNKDKIIITYEGIAQEIKKEQSNENDEKKALLCYNINKPFLLYVGNAYPHKNLETLVEVFLNIRKKYKNLSLVLVGKEDYFYARFKKYVRELLKRENLQEQKPIIFPGYVPDKDLKFFYQSACAYIFPSLYEGFGLPPLEAMANSCPVASSNKASMPEVLGQAAIYFNPQNKKEMQRAIEKIISDNDLRQNLIKAGLQQAAKYSWDKCAQQTFSILNNYM